MLKKGWVFVLLLSLSTMAFAGANASDYTGDYVMKTEADEIPFKLSMQASGKIRMDFNSEVGETSAIIRPDKQKIWNLAPQKTCMEMPLEGYITEGYHPSPKNLVESNKTGSEALLGYACDIFHFTEGPYQITTWLTRDNGIMLRSRIEEGKRWVLFEAKRIRLQKQPDELFEIPDGYQILIDTQE